MKLRLLLAFLSLAAAGAVFYVRAANNNASTPTPVAASSSSCSECDGPSPASVLPNQFKADSAKSTTETTPAPQAKN